MTILRRDACWPVFGCRQWISGARPCRRRITVASFGGAYGESQQKAYAVPFEAATGTHVNMTEYNGGLGEIRAQVESGAVAWDVVDVEMQDAVRGCDDGLFELLKDFSSGSGDGTPAADDFLPGTLTDCGVGSIVWSTILAVRDDSFRREADDGQGLLRFANFPGKRGAMKKPQTLLEWALIADGVDKADVYQSWRRKRAWRARSPSSIPSRTKWCGGTRMPRRRSFCDGEVFMTMAANGRIFDAIDNDKQPFSIVWDHQIWNLDLWAIPKGSEHAAAAEQFIAFAAEPGALPRRPSTSPTARCGNPRRPWSMPPSPSICRPPRPISRRRCRTTSSSGRTTATS